MNDNPTCPAGGKSCCPVRACLIPALAVFATIFVFDWVFHGMLLRPAYEATASLWRPEEEARSYFYICLIRMAVMAGVITCLYGWLCKSAEGGGKCLKTALKFGFKIGLLLGIVQFGSFVWLPIPMSLALSWLGGYIAEGLLIGAVLSCACRMKKA